MTRTVKVFFFAAVAAIFLGGAKSAHAQDCDAYIQSLQEISGSSTFDPFEPTAYERVVRLTAANAGTDVCQLRLRAVNPALGPRFLSGASLSYELYDPNNQRLQNDISAVSGSYEFTVPANGARDVFVRMEIERPQFARPATESTSDELVLFDQNSAIEYDRIDLSLSVDIVSRAQVNLAGVDAPFDRNFAINQISFGDLEAGKERQVWLQIRANEDIAVEFESNGDGFLREISGGSGRVPYSAYLSGSPVDLTGIQTISQVSPSSLAGLSLPLLFRIEPFGIQPANRYRDRVTITVTAQPG